MPIYKPSYNLHFTKLTFCFIAIGISTLFSYGTFADDTATNDIAVRSKHNVKKIYTILFQYLNQQVLKHLSFMQEKQCWVSLLPSKI